MTRFQLSNISFSVLKEELLWLRIVSWGKTYGTSFQQLVTFSNQFAPENNGTFLFKNGFFFRKFSSNSKNQVFSPSEMQIIWIPGFGELKNGNTLLPLFNKEERYKNPEEFKMETFFLNECRIDFGLKLAGEKAGQSFSELICSQPVLICLTFEKKSRQLVDLFVKPKTSAACFSKTFLVQDLYFAVRQNLALRSSSAEIQNL
jgi:hypothetical protein